jgi:phage anti-repressor protein
MTLINLKSLVKVIALFAMVAFSGTTLLATEINPVINLRKGIEKSFALYMDYESPKDFEITLKDKASQVLFRENVENSKQFAKQFNLEKLPDGIYFLTIEDNQTIYTRVIEVSENTLSIDEAKETKIFKPVVFQKGDKVFISAMLLEDSNAKITVYNKSNEVIFSEKIKNQTKIEKIFTFAEQNPEDHSIAIHYKGHSFYFDSLKSMAALSAERFAIKR